MSILDRPVVVRMAVDSSYIEVLYPVSLISPVVCSKSHFEIAFINVLHAMSCCHNPCWAQ